MPGKPVTAMFLLPETQHDFPAKAGSPEVSGGSHFLSDGVIEIKPGAGLSIAHVHEAIATVDPNLPVRSMSHPTQQKQRPHSHEAVTK